MQGQEGPRSQREREKESQRVSEICRGSRVPGLRQIERERVRKRDMQADRQMKNETEEITPHHMHTNTHAPVQRFLKSTSAKKLCERMFREESQPSRISGSSCAPVNGVDCVGVGVNGDQGGVQGDCQGGGQGLCTVCKDEKQINTHTYLQLSVDEVSAALADHVVVLIPLKCDTDV